MSTEVINKRLFIGGLSSNVSEKDVTEQFGRFGKITDVSLKRRKDESGNPEKTFAHLNIEGEEDKIKKCFAAYHNAKWKGSVLKLQYAKDNFLNKLVQERVDEKVNEAKERERAIEIAVQKAKPTWQPPVFESPVGPAVPGAAIPGKSDWIVGKYGRVLPVLMLKKSSRIRVVKHDPSKLCHTAKVFKEVEKETFSETPCSSLTWAINKPDSEIVKKMKGDFPKTSKKAQKRKQKENIGKDVEEVITCREYLKRKKLEKVPEVEVVPIFKEDQGQKTSKQKFGTTRFDSDIESDNDMDFKVAASNAKVDNSANSSVKKPVVFAKQRPRSGNSLLKPEYMFGKGDEILEEQSVKPLDTKPDSKEEGKPSKTSKKKQKLGDANHSISQSEKIILDESPNSSISKESNTINDDTYELEKSQSRFPEPKKQKKKNKKRKGRDNDSDEECPVPKFGGLSMLSIFKEGEKPSAIKDVQPIIEVEMETTSPQNPDHQNSTEQTDLEVVPIGKDKDNLQPKTKRSKFNSDVESDSEIDVKASVPLAKSVKKAATKSAVTKRSKDKKEHLNVPEKTTQEKEMKKKSDFTTNGIQSPDKSSSESHKSLLKPEYIFDTNAQNLASSKLACDSDDSDLDSNDFKVVAKILAKKAFEKSVKNKSLQISKLSKAETKQSSMVEVERKEAVLKTKTGDVKKEKMISDNQKRLQVLKDNMKQKEEQQKKMKEALSNIDSKKNSKRIVFSSDDGEDSDSDSNTEKAPKVSISSDKAPLMKTGKSLFASSSEDSGDESDAVDMFRSRPHLEGKKGETLMKLERRIGDSRFKLDAKFAESDSEGDSEKDEEIIEKEATGLVAEKEASLKVLEKVVGKTKLDNFTQKIKRNTKHIVDMNTVRFDPTKIATPEVEQEKERNKKSTRSVVEKKKPSSLSKPASNEIVPDKQALNENSEATATSKDDPEDSSISGTTAKESSEPASSSKVVVSSSLVDMFKNKEDEEVEGGFSLLSQFDQGEGHTPSKLADKPLSGLFKAKSADAVVQQSKPIKENAKDVESDSSTDKSEDEEKSDEEMSDEETSDEETSDKDIDESEGEDVKQKADKAVPIKGLAASVKKTHPLLNETNLFSEEIETDEEDLDSVEKEADESVEITKRPKDCDITDELTSAGQIDVRYTSDKWQERWDDIRPTLIKIYKRKHKEAVKNKRTISEQRRRKDISKYSKKNAWLRHKK